MTELEKIAYTKAFIDKMANGINPIDETEIPKNDLLNNIRISHCLFYVSDVLKDIITNGGIGNRASKGELPFAITPEQLGNVKLSDEPLSISNFVKLINEQVDISTYKKLKYTTISEWLVSIGLLFVETKFDKKRKRPPEKGKSMGIISENRVGYNGEYEAVLYNKDMQKFILDNIFDIIDVKDISK